MISPHKAGTVIVIGRFEETCGDSVIAEKEGRSDRTAGDSIHP